MIGIGEILVGIVAIVLAYIAYILKKQLRTFEKTQARRILDLMVIGVGPFLAGYLYSAGTQRGDKNPGNCRTADIPVWAG